MIMNIFLVIAICALIAISIIGLYDYYFVFKDKKTKKRILREEPPLYVMDRESDVREEDNTPSLRDVKRVLKIIKK